MKSFFKKLAFVDSKGQGIAVTVTATSVIVYEYAMTDVKRTEYSAAKISFQVALVSVHHYLDGGIRAELIISSSECQTIKGLDLDSFMRC